MPRWEADLRSIHQYCTRNRSLLARSEFAGCFYCEAKFNPGDIADWIDLSADVEAKDDELDHGETALCPHCGIDSVLPSAAPFAWDDNLLHDMHVHWFENGVEIEGAG